MELKQQKLGWMSNHFLGKWKAWIAVLLITTSLLLSSCSGTADYKTELGDPSLYKELYTQVTQDNKSLKRKLDNSIKENSKLKEKYAALHAQKLKDVVLSEREKALDERDKNISDREEQIKREQEKTSNTSTEIFDKSLEIGKTIGELEKDEERIKEISKELKSSKSLLIPLIGMIFVLIISVIILLAYIFLDKLGIITALKHDSTSKPRTINASVIEDKADELKPGNEPTSKSLSSSVEA